MAQSGARLTAEHSPAAIRATRFVVRPLLRLGYHYQSFGEENVPATGAAILAPNHTSFLDPIFVTYPIYRPLYFLAWHRLFIGHFGTLIRRMGAIPVDTDRKSDRGAFEGALEVLRAGELLCIFPEGMRGWDGALNPVQPGAARLAVATGSPIIPVVIEGALDVWPRWKTMPRIRGRVTVRYLPALVPVQPEGAKGKREAVEALRRGLEEALGHHLLPRPGRIIP